MALLRLPVNSDLIAFRFKSELDGSILDYQFSFNSRYERWFLNVFDGNGNALLTGRCININLDLLGRFLREDLPAGLLVAINLVNVHEEATLLTLGNDCPVLYEEAEG